MSDLLHLMPSGNMIFFGDSCLYFSYEKESVDSVAFESLVLIGW